MVQWPREAENRDRSNEMSKQNVNLCDENMKETRETKKEREIKRERESFK